MIAPVAHGGRRALGRVVVRSAAFDAVSVYVPQVSFDIVLLAQCQVKIGVRTAPHISGPMLVHER